MGVVYGKKLGQDGTNLFYICIPLWEMASVRFWRDHWCENHSLQNLYLALYDCVAVKDASLHFIWVSLVDGVGGVGMSSSTEVFCND